MGLASQPTLSRLENAVGWRVLARMGLRMIDTFCDSFARPPRQIVLDIDDTTDLVHGGQQLSLFNTPGGGYCFQPILIFEATTGKPVAAILRAGKRPSGEEAARVLCHAVRRMRSNWPRIAITVRGDAHYGTPEVMDVLEDMDCLYIFGLSGNKGLADISAPWRDDVATRRALGGKEKVRRFFQTHYAARSWRRDRRVIARVEATALGSDTRFIGTNIAGGRAKHLYEKVYCARGRMENMFKEHKLYLKSDRTSCHRWEANQFRLSLHTAAEIPMVPRHLRKHPQHFPQDRRSRRANENPHPRVIPDSDAKHRRHKHDARKTCCAGAVANAANAPRGTREPNSNTDESSENHRPLHAAKPACEIRRPAPS